MLESLETGERASPLLSVICLLDILFYLDDGDVVRRPMSHGPSRSHPLTTVLSSQSTAATSLDRHYEPQGRL